VSERRRRRLDELLDELLDAAGPARDEIFRRVEREDPGLAAELERLLAAHMRTAGILDSPARGTRRPPRPWTRR
jgi:hypothetical protein